MKQYEEDPCKMNFTNSTRKMHTNDKEKYEGGMMRQ